ncbi:MAG TPA: ABC transporter ATP-binding protein [Chloroflexota bacterium]|nr:ABC transporter ATP-binding protein [Chloroflexota bacterium]
MNTTSAISIQNVSKCYELGNRLTSLRDLLASATSRLRPALASSEPSAKFWALHGVSFEVPRGQTVGLVGANGAGKSTLLKLLSKVTYPSNGRIAVNGRVAALIELGAGFHPDLSGRDNVYLSGAILGLSRREIEQKLDAIIAFAELAPFIDTPVKRYSSGMYVRLGFSVAIHTDPDILLIDEVLAVGDFTFREKCVRKINELRRAGKTLIVVSHDRNMLEKLCDRIILIQRGRLIADGDPNTVLDLYHKTGEENDAAGTRPDVAGTRGPTSPHRPVEILDVQVTDEAGMPRGRFITGEPLIIRVNFVCHQAVDEPVFYCDIHHEFTWVLGTNTGRGGLSASFAAGDTGQIELVCQSLNLLTGEYHVDVGVVSDFFAWRPYHQVKRVARFEVEASLAHGAGLVHLPHTWRLRKSPSGEVAAVGVARTGGAPDRETG